MHGGWRSSCWWPSRRRSACTSRPPSWRRSRLSRAFAWFGGAPWDKPEAYVRWSPSQFAKEFRTPTLVIHGEQDYRVPYGQGLQLFTALQLQQVPSKLLLFPDEGHWILKPANSLLWYKTSIEWLDFWVKK